MSHITDTWEELFEMEKGTHNKIFTFFDIRGLSFHGLLSRQGFALQIYF